MTPPPPLSREFRFLARAVAPSIDDGMTPPHGLDWALLLALAERHRVTPALAEALQSAGIEPPEPVATSIEIIVRQAIFDELALAATVRELTDAAAEAGLTLGLLKGIPLSLMLHGRLGLRVSRDIDLLVAPEDAERAFALLAGLGFQPLGDVPLATRMRRNKDIELAHPTRCQIVELHWRLFDNPRLTPSVRLEKFDLPMGFSANLLPDRDHMLYLANHGCQHGWSRLKWLADFARFAARFDAETLETLYRETPLREGRRALGQAFILCANLFGTPLPRGTDRRDWRARVLVRIALRCLAASGPAELETLRFGSTAKNLSHYLLSSDPAYLLAEARLDLTDHSAAPPGSPSRRYGAAGRLLSWIARHGRGASHTN